MRSMQFFVSISSVFFIVSGDFTPDFNSFLTQTYGPAMQSSLERKDLQTRGSFGGRANAGQALKNEPVILVHGITNSASQFHDIGDHFVSKGYNWAEIYATTWGDAGKTVFFFVDMKCAYVKQALGPVRAPLTAIDTVRDRSTMPLCGPQYSQPLKNIHLPDPMIRSFIQAVNSYTGMKVDVIGYSMGSPIARKAIMGGYCVDTGEYLGPPLTGIVDTFVGVAGANNGVSSCFFPIPLGICNGMTGLSCGSAFLNDINRSQRYEGSFIFTIYSPQDDKVGYQVCGQLASTIAGQNQGFQQSGNHETVLHATKELQRTLVLAHSA